MGLLTSVGGTLAHPDAYRRSKKGADYLFEDAVIELKMLDEDGLEKVNRQRKLANIFEGEGYKAPVVVLDRENLSGQGKIAFDRALDGPIKSAVSSAKKQLVQTRRERPETKLSILWIVNNGYSALSHDDLSALAARRVRNDTSKIDGIIVSGCYYHSDGFENYFFWPIDYIPIHHKSFNGFNILRSAWDAFADDFMTGVVHGLFEIDATKYPVLDNQFDVDGRTFVRPAPPIGGQSDFFREGRPRQNSSGIFECPPVAQTFPGFTKKEWLKFRKALPEIYELRDSYSEWRQHEKDALKNSMDLKPLVRVPFSFKEWESRNAGLVPSDVTMSDIYEFASVLFQERIQCILGQARELKEDGVRLSRYILVITDEIGQDKANDLSHIAKVTLRPDFRFQVVPIVEDLRIFHEHALALAGAYALKEGFDQVMWIKQRKYAWM